MQYKLGGYLDHPMTWKWLVIMVSKSPNWGCSTSNWPKWLINGGYKLLTEWGDPPSIQTMVSSYPP